MKKKGLSMALALLLLANVIVIVQMVLAAEGDRTFYCDNGTGQGPTPEGLWAACDHKTYACNGDGSEGVHSDCWSYAQCKNVYGKDYAILCFGGVSHGYSNKVLKKDGEEEIIFEGEPER
jgi:hypothetical protein